MIISLRQYQMTIRMSPDDPDTIIRRKGCDELDRFCVVVGLASEGAVTSKEAGRIDAIRAQRPNPIDIGLLLERGDALKAVRISDAADRIVLDAEVVEALTERLDTIRNEAGDQTRGGHTQRAQILEREPVVTGLLARAHLKVGRDLGPPELVEAAGSAPEISRRVYRCAIGADQGDDCPVSGGASKASSSLLRSHTARLLIRFGDGMRRSPTS